MHSQAFWLFSPTPQKRFIPSIFPPPPASGPPPPISSGGGDREGVPVQQLCSWRGTGPGSSRLSENTARNQCPPSPTLGLPVHIQLLFLERRASHQCTHKTSPRDATQAKSCSKEQILGPKPSSENAGATGARLESGQVCLPTWLPSLKSRLHSPSELCRQDYNCTPIALQTHNLQQQIGPGSQGAMDDFIKLKVCTAHAHSLVLAPSVFYFKSEPAMGGWQNCSVI